MGYVRRFFLILTSNHCAFIPPIAVAIFHNISWKHEDKTDTEACLASLRVQLHRSGYQKQLLRAQSALIYRNYNNQWIPGGRIHICGYIFVFYNNYMMSCGPLCTFVLRNDKIE